MKESLKSTEFWLTVLTLLIVSTLFWSGNLSKDEWLDFMKIVVPGYAVARGLAKFGSK